MGLVRSLLCSGLSLTLPSVASATQKVLALRQSGCMLGPTEREARESGKRGERAGERETSITIYIYMYRERESGRERGRDTYIYIYIYIYIERDRDGDNSNASIYSYIPHT